MNGVVLSDAEKEKIKLRATFFNGFGIGVMLIGVLTPTTRLIYGDISASVSATWRVASPLARLLLGLAPTFDWSESTRKVEDMTESLILFLTPIVGVACVAAFVWWQNERDAALRESHSEKK